MRAPWLLVLALCSPGAALRVGIATPQVVALLRSSSLRRHPQPLLQGNGKEVTSWYDAGQRLSNDAPEQPSADVANPVDGSASVDAWGRPIAPPAFEMPSFNFNSGEAKPGPERGKGGLNEQGYEPYAQDEAIAPSDSTYAAFLGGFALLSVALSVFNAMSDQ